MSKILVIGCGGVASVLIRELNFLFKTGQITDSITIADNDTIEMKNIKYQLFEPDEILQNKAEVLGKRYNFSYKSKHIEEKDLKEMKPDVILMCVDNSKTRQMVYEYCEKNKCYFIDMRAEGRGVCIFTKHKKNTLQVLNKTLDFSVGSTSCQLKFELDKGIIQRGNFIVANIGTQLLLNHLRGEENLPSYNYQF